MSLCHRHRFYIDQIFQFIFYIVLNVKLKNLLVLQGFQSGPVPGTFTRLRSCIVPAEIIEPPKKIASSRFQSPVKKKNRKLRHWRQTVWSLVMVFNVKKTFVNVFSGWYHNKSRGRQGRDCMVVGIITSYAISAYHH
jgi:hypothetical protein